MQKGRSGWIAPSLERDTLEARRDWRVRLAGRNWNIFSRATLRNTRAVVRYLARYTSRIAMSNSRIKASRESISVVGCLLMWDGSFIGMLM